MPKRMLIQGTYCPILICVAPQLLEKPSIAIVGARQTVQIVFLAGQEHVRTQLLTEVDFMGPRKFFTDCSFKSGQLS
jgi:hypothetical protein